MTDINKTILVADSDYENLERIGEQLKALGFNVLTAENEEETETILSESQVDLALLTLTMNHGDSGFVLSHRIKKQSPSLPIIIMAEATGDTSTQFLTVTVDENRSWIKADMVVDKAMRFEQLKSRIENLLHIA